MSAAVRSFRGFSLITERPGTNGFSPNHQVLKGTSPIPFWALDSRRRLSSGIRFICSAKLGSSGNSIHKEEVTTVGDEEAARQLRRSADWKAARAYKESGSLFEGKVEGLNNGGLLIRFYSLLGFLPYPLLGPYSCKDAERSIQDVSKDLVGSSIVVKVIEAGEDERKLIFSEKDAVWSKYSTQVKVGEVFDGRVGSVEDYGAFVHLRFPDGQYHLTGLVHVSEVSWDLVQDVRDFINEGDQVKVKVVHIDSEKSRINLSMKQLEDDPLLETLDKVIPQEGQPLSDPLSMSASLNLGPLSGLENICNELLQEDGITEVRLGRQGLEKRVVSQDLELWLSNVPAKDNQFTLLARAGRQVQEVYLTTTLDQESIKKAVQRVLGRVP